MENQKDNSVCEFCKKTHLEKACGGSFDAHIDPNTDQTLHYKNVCVECFRQNFTICSNCKRIYLVDSIATIWIEGSDECILHARKYIVLYEWEEVHSRFVEVFANNEEEAKNSVLMGIYHKNLTKIENEFDRNGDYKEILETKLIKNKDTIYNDDEYENEEED